MLRRLFQWLKKWLQRFFSSQQTRPLNTARRYKVVDSLPELTNADLELLFNQLLDGVSQARGRQWVLQYLQRMEDRITEEHWIDWLLNFAEKLFISPAPNHQLATRMVQLGELDIGRLGDLAHDIGMRLLTRDLATRYEEDEDEPQVEFEATTLEETLLNTPGQELIRNLGDRLWDYDEQEAEIVTPKPKLISFEEAWTGNLEAVMYEDEAELGLTAAEEAPLLPSADDAIANLWELFGEAEQEVANDDIATIPATPTVEEEVITTSPAEDEDDAVLHLFDLLREPEADEVEFTPPAENSLTPAAEDEDDAMLHLFDLLREPEADEVEFTPPAENSLTPAAEDEDDAMLHLFDLLRESDGDEGEFTSSVTSLTPAAEGTWDQSLANIEPNVADTLDELLVRLDQSTNLVQDLATELAIQRSTPKAIVQQHSNQAQSWFYQGLQQAKTGDLLGAIASYERAIEMQPDFYEYWFNRGLMLFHLEQFAEAIASYDQAVELKPDFYKAWYNRGGVLGELGEFDAAIASFERAIDIKPDAAECWSSRGLALLKLGQIWESISSYDQALLLQPQDQENWYYRGIALAVGEQYAEAIASYDKALEIHPDYYEVWIDRGVVLFNLGQWSEAIASWDHALSIQSDFYLAWYNRGVALDNLGRREEAITSYGKVIAIKPDFHLAWYNQAVALFYLGRFVEAIASYDGALEIKLDYWEAWIGRGSAVANLVNPDALASLFTTITATNTALKQSGYAGKLASLEAGLEYVRPDTHPEGWGRLHLAIANTYYEHGRKHPPSRHEWQQAVAEYNQALLTLTSTDFPQLHLEILQSLVKVHVGLGEIPAAQELQEYGIDLLQQLLSEPTRSDDGKKQLALKFAGFGQLAVDLAVSYGDLVEAWEIAEQGKNACLTWLLYGWHEEIYSPNYHSIQHLLNPTTAIIYWHISPTALHTFILKDGAPSPILLFTPIQDIGVIHLGSAPMLLDELPIPEAVRRLIAFENWLEDWHEQYQEYRSQTQDKQNNHDHSWRVDMAQKLLQLKDILNISTIEQELEGITQLVLIPHRDLYRIPLHTLFQFSSDFEPKFSTEKSNLTITYLPSVQTGLTLKTAPQWNKQRQLLLNIEHPHTTNYSPLKFAKLQAEIVQQMFTNSSSIQSTQANKSTVENALYNDYNILHFIGYLINNYHEPKKSELVLTDEDRLTLADICQQTLVNYDLATFSACETINITHPINSEYVSFVSGLLSRGVPQVISTLWTVESFASALVLIEFYRRLQPDKSAATALAEATAWLRELTALELTKWYEDLLHNLHPDELRIRAYVATQQYRSSKMPPEQKLYSHPYYWAGFIITGKPS
ncbi:MAG: tetratricopeptide repeat protein [Goleter apudmare HA4340-LM2]|jgi:CHAT domain-containing protein/Flp pilus assembly protein TadD|nr:tetratricopeptide repeat protein [Goleter apudmare HA4340-LM2]